MEDDITRNSSEVEQMILRDLNSLDDPDQPKSYTTLAHAIGLEKIQGLDFPIRWDPNYDPFDMPETLPNEYGVYLVNGHVYVVGGIHSSFNSRVFTVWRGDEIK